MVYRTESCELHSHQRREDQPLADLDEIGSTNRDKRDKYDKQDKLTLDSIIERF